jgi:hypothetical protein
MFCEPREQGGVDSHSGRGIFHFWGHICFKTDRQRGGGEPSWALWIAHSKDAFSFSVASML